MHSISVYVVVNQTQFTRRFCTPQEMVLPIVGYCVEEAMDIATEDCIDDVLGCSDGDSEFVHPEQIRKGAKVRPLRMVGGEAVEWQVDFSTGDQYVIRKSQLLVEENENGKERESSSKSTGQESDKSSLSEY